LQAEDGIRDFHVTGVQTCALPISVPTPPYLFNTLLANGGSMTNKGVEVAINADIVKKDNWTWSSSFNLSHNKNRIGSLSSNIGKIGRASCRDRHEIRWVDGAYQEI